jgi:chitin deacetylase
MTIGVELGRRLSLSLIIACFALFATPALAAETTAPSTKEIALTFDDGPYGTSTAEVLNILEKEQVHATFFLIGKNVDEYPALAQREVADGDLIGNHSYDHSMTLASLSPIAFELNLLQAQLSIASTTGVFPKIFRPPYGLLSGTMRRILSKDGFQIDMWTIDTEDWNYQKSPSATIIKDVLTQAKSNSVILFHDGRDTKVGYPRDNLITALPVIIDDLKQDGYTFVTIDKLISI